MVHISICNHHLFLNPEGTIGDNISYDGAKEGKDMLLQLMIDNGVPTRGHTTNIFNPEFKMVLFVQFKELRLELLAVHIQLTSLCAC